MIKGYYNELKVIESKRSRIVGLLNKFIKTKYKKRTGDSYDKIYDPKITHYHAASRVSYEALKEAKKSGDRKTAGGGKNYDGNLKGGSKNNRRLNKLFTNVFDLIYPEIPLEITDYHLSGFFHYPDNGFMGWHTNSNNQGYRLYCTYAREANKSFFRYQDPVTKKIITSWDKKGWTFRIFKITDKLLWHSVYSETDRYSIGFAMHTKKYPSPGG